MALLRKCMHTKREHSSQRGGKTIKICIECIKPRDPFEFHKSDIFGKVRGERTDGGRVHGVKDDRVSGHIRHMEDG